MSDCSVHWAGPVTLLVIAQSFCGVQLGAGALVSHLDLAFRHAALVVAVSGTVGSSTYFILPAFRRIMRAAHQVDLSGRFVNLDKWEHRQDKRKLVSWSKHGGCLRESGVYTWKIFEIVYANLAIMNTLIRQRVAADKYNIQLAIHTRQHK